MQSLGAHDTTEVANDSAPTRDRLIRRPEVLRLVGVGRSTWDSLIRDGKAPRGTSLTRKCVVWSEREIQNWLTARLAERNTLKPGTVAGK